MNRFRTISYSFQRSFTTGKVPPVSLQVHPSSKIATLTLQSSPVNALTSSVLLSLNEQLNHLQSLDIKGLILCSRFPKIVSAGLDLNTLSKKENETRNEFHTRFSQYMSEFQTAASLLLQVRVPTIGIVRGASPAGGCVLMLCCDYRIGSRTSSLSIGLNEVAVGMAPPPWIHALAEARLGKRIADRALQLGVIVNNKDGLRMGFIDELVDVEDKTEWDVLYAKACDEIEKYHLMPHNARVSAKSICNQSILKHMNDDAIEYVANSVSGDEFQLVVKSIIASLKSKK